MIDPTAPGALRLMADRAKEQIEQATTKPARYSWRIKPSKLGSECIAELWYAWRWVTKKEIPGINARKMDRGTDREKSLVDYIRRSGWDVQDTDPAKGDRKFNQWGFKALDGHMSAYLDGVGSHPDYFGGAPGNIEIKTMNKGRFNKLSSKNSLMVAEYEYYCQIVLYMDKMNLAFTYFLAECQDTQELYSEFLLPNPELALRLIAVAETVKTSKQRPARVAQQPTFHKCRTCDYLNICHYDAAVDVNCRSCVHCVAAPDGKFYCEGWGRFIPGEREIMLACPQHTPVK